jgi:hypothetical protein
MLLLRGGLVVAFALAVNFAANATGSVSEQSASLRIRSICSAGHPTGDCLIVEARAEKKKKPNKKRP